MVEYGGEKVDAQADKTSIGANATDIGANATDIGKTANRVQVLPSNPVKAVDYFPYMCEIGKTIDLIDIHKVELLHEAYYDLGDGNRVDVGCPLDVKFLKKQGFDKKGRPDYDYPDNLGLKPGTEKPVNPSNLPEFWDRMGWMGGTNFSDVPEGRARYTNEERSLANIENPEAYHYGTWDGVHYKQVIDAIDKGNLDALNELMDKKGLKRVTDDFFDKLTVQYKDFIDYADGEVPGVDATYGIQGIANDWKELPGGAPQYTLPFSGAALERLGVMKETKGGSCYD